LKLSTTEEITQKCFSQNSKLHSIYNTHTAAEDFRRRFLVFRLTRVLRWSDWIMVAVACRRVSCRGSYRMEGRHLSPISRVTRMREVEATRHRLFFTSP
ncbi:unnamed protein product, partial [Ascophyllum nodosum]